MAESTIRDLRNYAATLKDNSPMAGEFLVDAIAKQAERLRRFYGINVKFQSEISSRLDGRLAGEVFQIVSESLSNVLRHTSAKNAFVSILCEDTQVLLKVGNETGAGASGPLSFMPRSINERVRAMGGKTSVERDVENFAVVSVSIPLQQQKLQGLV
jgi:signal transduction histidine kinase